MGTCSPYAYAFMQNAPSRLIYRVIWRVRRLLGSGHHTVDTSVGCYKKDRSALNSVISVLLLRKSENLFGFVSLCLEIKKKVPDLIQQNISPYQIKLKILFNCLVLSNETWPLIYSLVVVINSLELTDLYYEDISVAFGIFIHDKSTPFSYMKVNDANDGNSNMLLSISQIRSTRMENLIIDFVQP